MPSPISRQVPCSLRCAGDGRGFDRLLVETWAGLTRFPAADSGERIVAIPSLSFVEPGERFESSINQILAIQHFAHGEHRIGEAAVGVTETRLWPRLESFLEARRGGLQNGSHFLILRMYPPQGMGPKRGVSVRPQMR
jgi:hypothetical protein